MNLIAVYRELGESVGRLRFGPPVTHVYNPLEYAWEAHRQYLERFGRGQREVLLLGMNPGPWGMVQTGIPFGDVEIVRDWLGIRTGVGKPKHEHPKRPVMGFDCHRREKSGERLWGWAKERFGSPDRFFDRFLVLNYCPLCLLEASGRNRTPERLPAKEAGSLFDRCDDALRRAVGLLRPRHVVGIGRFAEARARKSLEADGVTVGFVQHPSPANPRAGADWGRTTDQVLARLWIDVR